MQARIRAGRQWAVASQVAEPVEQRAQALVPGPVALPAQALVQEPELPVRLPCSSAVLLRALRKLVDPPASSDRQTLV